MKIFIVFSLLCVACNGKSLFGRQRRATCDALYTDLDPNHTMCLTEAAGSEASSLTDAEKQAMVDSHNAYRAQSDAVGMMKVVWDDDVAKVAMKWARQCQRGHDTNTARVSPELAGIKVGQNMAFFGARGSNNIIRSIDMWHDEIAVFVYNQGPLHEGNVTGHYVQVVAENVARIGCARAYCNDWIWKEVVACNYARQLTYTMVKPYELCTEPSCKETCPRDADGLCDCGGQLCFNGGTLDKASCTCTCSGLYIGSSCETLVCEGAKDTVTYCASNPNYCNYASIRVKCPIHCKTCPSSCTKECQNGGIQNSTPCLCSCSPDWTGELCETSLTATTTATEATTTEVTTTTSPTTVTDATTTAPTTPTTTITDSTTQFLPTTPSTTTTTESTTVTDATTTAPTTPTTTITDSTTPFLPTTPSTTTTESTTVTDATTTAPTTPTTTITDSTTPFLPTTPSTTTESTTPSLGIDITSCYIMLDGVRVYRGTLSTSNSGFTCQPWVEKYPISHGYTDVYFANTNAEFFETAADAGNYCRDPSAGSTRASGRLWCYNGEGRSPKWDWCDDVPDCTALSTPECAAPCENNGIQDPETCECACDPGWTGPLCADPDCNIDCLNGGIQDPVTCECSCLDGFSGTTCETMAVDVTNCYVMLDGVRVYRGTLSTSNSGFTCQPWVQTYPNYHRYTDVYFDNTNGEFPETAADAGNFCRDLSAGSTRPSGRLWCYNGEGRSPKWDWCDAVQECSTIPLTG